MPTNSNKNMQNNDEIDLLTLFAKLGELLKKSVLGLINLIGAVLVFLIRKWYYFAIAVILTLITALILKTTTDPYYYTDLVIRSNATNNQPIMTSLNKLGEYATQNNAVALASELNMNTEDASKIKGLETFWYYDIGDDGIYDGIDLDGRYLSDTNIIKVENEFVVRAAIKDPDILHEIEEGLLYYLGSNPYLDAVNKQRLSDLEERLIQTQYEIEKLDSLQKREYYTNTDQLRQKEGQIVFTSENIAQTYHNDMFRLLRSRLEYERDLNIFREVVTIREGFTIPIKPDNGTIKYAKKLIWYYLGFALMISVIISFRKKIWTN